MRRALDAEDKQTRRAAILEAARELFRQSEGGLPTAAEVAAAAGLAKGTVYLYFQTKEEIFANLLLEGWLPVMEGTRDVFGRSRGPALEQAYGFVTALVEHVRAHPELLRLDALGAAVLERNMSREALVEYKSRFHAGLSAAGERIDEALRLRAGRGVTLLMRSYALARGLSQTAQHAEALEGMGVGEMFPAVGGEFAQELAEALREYWRGALAEAE